MTAPLMALAIPLLDTALAIIRRFLRQRLIFGADRGHIHHRLLNRGFTPRKVALVLYGCCALGAIASLAMMNQNYSGFVIVAFCAVTWIGIQHLGYIEFGLASRMVIEGAFRRQLNAQLALNTIEQQLAAATTFEECWCVIRDAADQFGFHRVCMKIFGRLFEHGDGITIGSWSLRVTLGDFDFIELERSSNVLSNATTMAPFAGMPQQTLYSKRSMFEPPLFHSASAGDD